jgi:hypothetical protein
MATAFKDPESEAQESRVLEAARPIINRLNSLAMEQARLRRPIETRWLSDLGNYFGRYDDRTHQELTDAKRSTAFVKLTRHKTNSWAARIGDILFPTDDKNWDVKPTPVPKLVQQAKDAVKQAEAVVEAANATADPEQQQRIKEIADSFAAAARQSQSEIEEAQKRCARMKDVIDDQLVESDYVAQCRMVIEDGCRLGTGILKGPLTANRLRAEWRPENDNWVLAQNPDPTPEFRRIDPWHFFPDMSATRIAEAEFSFERHLPTRKDLRNLARKLGFNKAAVRRLIEEGPKPLGLEVEHLTMLRAITGEGEQIKDRYCMWEFHGSLETDEITSLLRAAGQDEKARQFEQDRDPLDDYRVIVYFCDNEILKIAAEYPLDSGESLYSVWNFEKGETSIFGIGVPNVMADSQGAINGGWRMILDNAALSVGPQIIFNPLLVAPHDNSYGLRPLKTWLLSSTAQVSPNAFPFQAINIPIQTDALLKIIELAKAFIDEETGMPTIAQGEQGAATQTLGGMSILFNSANVIFRRVVKLWDDEVTKPTIRRAYDWNMQFHPDKSIKGDMQVDARGSSVLLVREIQSQTLMNIMTNWTTHPVIGPWLACKKNGVRPGLEKTLQTLMIAPDDILGTPDEYERYMREQAEQQGEEASDPNAARLQIATLEAQTREKIANMQMEIEVAKLAAATGKSEQEIKAKYGIEEMKVGSAERMKAVDIAVEKDRERRAQEEGRSEAEAVGTGVG